MEPMIYDDRNSFRSYVNSAQPTYVPYSLTGMQQQQPPMQQHFTVPQQGGDQQYASMGIGPAMSMYPPIHLQPPSSAEYMNVPPVTDGLLDINWDNVDFSDEILSELAHINDADYPNSAPSDVDDSANLMAPVPVPPQSYPLMSQQQQHLQQQQMQHHQQMQTQYAPYAYSVYPQMIQQTQYPMYVPQGMDTAGMLAMHTPPQPYYAPYGSADPRGNSFADPSHIQSMSVSGGNRKHKRADVQPSDVAAVASVAPVEEEGEDREGVIKTMRFGSLGRIIASTTAATAKTTEEPTKPQQSEEERRDFRREVVTKMMRCLQRSDMNGLAKVIREHFAENVLWITPDHLEPITGRGDVMMYFSLMLEVFPDGVWTVSSIAPSTIDNQTITCLFRFAGTKLFQFSMDVLFRQIRSHIVRDHHGGDSELSHQLNSKMALSSAERLTSEKLMNEVTEGCLALPIESSTGDALSVSSQSTTASNHTANSTNSNAGATITIPSDAARRSVVPLRISLSREGSLDSVHNAVLPNGSNAADDDAIRFPRRVQSLRDVKNLENTVLRDGQTSYRRKLDMVFDDSNKVIRMLATNLSPNATVTPATSATPTALASAITSTLSNFLEKAAL